MTKTRKILCLLLSAAMLAGLMPAASSAVKMVEEVFIYNYEYPLIGETPADMPKLDVPDGADYVLDDFCWCLYPGREELGPDQPFAEGQLYSMMIRLCPEEGFTFSNTVSYTLARETDQGEISVKPEELIIWSVPVLPAAGRILEVAVNDFTLPSAGQAFSSLPVLSVPDGANYSLAYGWYSLVFDSYIDANGAFASGGQYCFNAYVTPDEGYVFSTEVTFSLNGDEIPTDDGATLYRRDFIDFWTKPVEFSATAAKQIYVFNYTDPVIGQTAADSLSSIVVWGDAEALVTFWENDTEKTVMADSDTFSPGCEYRIVFTVVPSEGFMFDPAHYPKIEFAGHGDLLSSEYTHYENDCNELVFCTVNVSPSEPGLPSAQITRVDLNGFTVPSVSQTAAENLAPVIISENCVISEIGWVNAAANRVMSDNETFAAGNTYYIYTAVLPADGYSFDQYRLPTAYINGSTSLVDGYYSGFQTDSYNRPVFVFFSVDITPREQSDATLITEIRIEGYRPPLIGQTAAENLSSLEFSDGVIPVDIGWINDTNGRQMEDDETFESGKSYYIYFNFTAGSHYYFDEDLIPATYVNNSTLLVDSDYTRFNDDLFVFFTVNVSPSEDNGKELITKVNLTGFETPVAGMTFAEFKAAISVEDGAPYTIYDMACFSYANESNMDDGDRYEAGKQYYFYFLILPDEGYEFNYDAGLPTSYLNGGRDLIDDDWSGIYTSGDGTMLFGFGTVDIEVETPEIKYGDVNGDGKVNGQDLVRLRKYLSGDPTAVIGPGANVTGDAGGVVNGQDLIRLRKYLNTEDESLLGPQT